ncbi:MAG: universal stress protein [Acidimicrobiia bacterium]|nr:universal stress protein [Acidimicrobiia bacterium]MDH5522220.1 universal stress protein [Acidimicrobiia bacterium]
MLLVVGIDESEHAGHVVDRAIQEAELRGAELHVVHVFHPPILPYMGAPIDMGALATAQRKAVWDRLEPHLAKAKMDVERVDLEGYPPDTLVDYVANTGAQLLIVGSRGRGEIAALVLGSTSHRAIHLANCDVLVVKPSHA